LRLAVLLIGDAYTADAVVLDSFAALHRLRKRPQPEDDDLPHLRRLVARSRLAASPSMGRQQAAPRGAGLP
jgi:hypothetical protein